MGLSAKTIRAQLNFFKPFMTGLSLETTRKGQAKIGELMEAMHRKDVIDQPHSFSDFEACWILPRDERRQGVILYLHGGGYTCGDLEYAKGFGSVLAAQTGAKVFCPAYRLAPEYPFPAALEDSLVAYRYLLDQGYSPRHITLCGESAGGGLCYALCLKLREINLSLPCGIIGISPWTDMTASGGSYTENLERDPSITPELLQFYADCYTNDPQNPLVSPLLGDLNGMPPSLIFVGGDEIMLDDAQLLHEKLLSSGCKSQLVVAPERWHAYVLYNLVENASDWDVINRFLNQHMVRERKLRWMRLDNAAKIYPASLSRKWSNVFRLSTTLTEPVDVPVLQRALDITVRRFPSICVRLRKGMFWYYLQQMPHAPQIRQEVSHPIVRMPLQEIRKCAFRVVVYKNRIATEFFHALTDGNGGMVFLKTLLAEYIHQKYGVLVVSGDGILDRLEEPSPAELEDCFQKYAADVSASRSEPTAWHLSGTREPDGFLNLTCFRLNVKDALAQAHKYGVSLTEFLCAVMLDALLDLQKEVVLQRRRRRPVKVLIPVNLRRLFPSRSLRNFVLYSIPSIDPKLGEYTFAEICHRVHHQMALDVNAKHMSTMIATNINSERSPVLKVMPLFIKNAAMKAVFNAVGECKSCLTLSNLGAVKLPAALAPYVERMDFILSPQASHPHNCGVLSYGDWLYINFIRNTMEPELEAHFYASLKKLGLNARVESNRP
ncbi:MAG: alpha/beta hydrolase [Oscillospiraceae bacterium]|nr:alpha/beta hydrolase [Oscillospiraceae bacterium]